MTRDHESAIWERVSGGQHVAAVGFSTVEPPPSLRVVRVSCDIPQTTLGPIFDARRKIEQLQGEQGALIGQARELVMSGLRRRFLGDLPPPGPDATLVESGNRLLRHDAFAADGGAGHALIFDAVDSADEATCASLARIVERPGWLELPLVLVMRDRDPQGPAAELLDALRRAHGDAAVVTAELVDRAGDRSAGDETPAPDFRDLPWEVLQVLRAGAVVGTGFEAELVAELLELSPLDVLDCLQRAADLGVPLEDRGEGRFFLSPALLAELRRSLLPSLASAWHRSLAALLRGDDDPAGVGGEDEGEDEDEDEDEGADTGREDEPPAPDGSPAAPPYVASIGERLPEVDASPPPVHPPQEPLDTYAQLFDRSPRVEGARDRDAGASGEPTSPQEEAAPDEAEAADRPGDASHRAAGEPDGPPGPDAAGHAAEPDDELAAENPASEAVTAGERVDTTDHEPVTEPWGQDDLLGALRRAQRRAREGRRGPEPLHSRYRDDVRAAGHLDAAGDADAAAERYANASVEAAALGAYSQAMAHGQRALGLIESLPGSPARRRFRVRLLLGLGRLQWQAASTHGGRPDTPDATVFTLTSAMRTAEAAQRSLARADPPELIAEAAGLIAGICYDLGDIRSLERALDELTSANRLLQRSGDPLGAARLLNDQAAVYVRVGDPVRASHLLSRSQAVFEDRSHDDPVVVVELAETQHLLAKLPLHARIRAGREDDAYALGLDHAVEAADKYQKLGHLREVGRVWETMGRLELCRGRLDRATTRLSTALKLQSQLGDITGLARSSAALSDVLARAGKLEQALSLLGDSIALNREKGSPIGLAFNRRALAALTVSLAEVADDAELNATTRDLGNQLATAEALIGRIHIPGTSAEA